jgi:hypothetical protein
MVFNSNLTKFTNTEIKLLLDTIIECYDPEDVEITSYEILEDDDNTSNFVFDAEIIYYGKYEIDRDDYLGPIDNWYASSVQWMEFEYSPSFDERRFRALLDERLSLSIIDDDITLYTPDPEDGEIVILD